MLCLEENAIHAHKSVNDAIEIKTKLSLEDCRSSPSPSTSQNQVVSEMHEGGIEKMQKSVGDQTPRKMKIGGKMREIRTSVR